MSITALLVTDSEQERVVLWAPVAKRTLARDPIIPFLILGTATFIGMFIVAFILLAAPAV